MEFKINITKKHLYYLVGLLVFVFITAIAIAQTSAPNPGHAATEIGEGTIANTLTVSGGNVGIGTTKPSHKLNVVGSANITGGIYTESTSFFGNGVPANIYNYFNTDSREWIVGVGQSGGDDKFLIQDSTASTTRFLIDTAGNVGIGTTSPADKLHISSSGDTGFRITGVKTGSDGEYGYIYGVNSAGNVASAISFRRIGTDTSSGISFYTANAGSESEKMRINPDGNVGIGTTSPAEKLEVAGNIRAGLLRDRDDTNYYVDPAATSRFYHGSFDGNVGIGTASPRGRLQIGNLHDTFGLPTYPGDIILDKDPGGSNGVGGIEFRSSVSAAGAGWKITASGNYQNSKLFFANRAGGTTWDTEVLTLAHTGNVGIGTTSPAATLDVQGGIRAHAVLETKCDSCSSDQKIWQLNTQDGGFYIGTWNDARNAEQLAYQIGRSGYTVTSHNWLINSQYKMKLDSNGNLAINNLAGTGNAYACVNVNGQLYRSATACS